MSRIFSALTLSVALALSGNGAKAELDGGDAARVLGGLATLYILKEALEDRSERRKPDFRAPPVRRDRHYQPEQSHQQLNRRYRPDRFDRWPHGNARIAPARCERTFEGRRGLRLGYGARCMWRNVARPRLLPDVCLRQIRTRRGLRQIYPRACLQRAGWITSARR